MKYFVGTTLSTQVQWQLELMIESFKYLGIQDKLYIYLSTDGKPVFHDSFCHNLQNHNNLHIQPNYGKRRGYLPLNDLYNLVQAINDNVLSDEFIMIPTDAVIFKEPEPIEEPLACKFQTDLLFSPEVIHNEVNMIDNFDINPSEVSSEVWPFASKFFQFKNFHVSFFEDLLFRTEQFIFNQLSNKVKVFDKTMQLAMNLQLKMSVGKYLPIQTNNLSNQLLDHEINHFVDYEKGYYPIFNKSMFKFNPIALADPFEVLASHKPTYAFAYLSGLAERYLKNRHVQKN